MLATTHRTSDQPHLGTAAMRDGILQGRRLVLASNRGPVEFQWAKRGRLEAQRGSGGVVTALSALSRHLQLSWVASALTEGDRAVGLGHLVERLPAAGDGSDVRLRFVVHPPEQYELYYNVFANPILWFVQHGLQALLPHSDFPSLTTLAWSQGYRPVNRAFAEAVLEELARDDVAPVAMLHDYQLYLAADYIRQRAPAVLLQQFIHIPWPEPAAWEALPAAIVRAICRGLLANDIVGFQTKRDGRNFLATCRELLPEARVDGGGGVVGYAGRRTYVRAYPISVDVAALRKTAASAPVAEYERRLRPLCGEQTIVRVDRLDPSKNVLSGFRAYARLLEARPDLHGRVKFLAFLVPSRTGIPQYKQHAQEVFAEVEAINVAYSRDGWRPIEVFYENNYQQAIAGMRLYDVLMVNSALDGMNLVSKEGPIVNTRDGVLVLSRGAGSYEELAPGALGVEPYDVEGTARALARALAMPAGERRARSLALRRSIEDNDVADWLQAQLADLSLVAKAGAVAAGLEAALARSA